MPPVAMRLPAHEVVPRGGVETRSAPYLRLGGSGGFGSAGPPFRP